MMGRSEAVLLLLPLLLAERSVVQSFTHPATTRTLVSPPSPLFLKHHHHPRHHRKSVTRVGVSSTRNDEIKSLTQRIMERTSSSGQTGGAGGVSTWDAFLRCDAAWSQLKSFKPSDQIRPPPFVTSDGARGNPLSWSLLGERFQDGKDLDCDVAVCGGTLGIFVAAVLQRRGFRVVVLEAGRLQGREQEWNISRKEMEELIELGILTEDEVEEVITTEFPGCRAGFKNEEVSPTKGGYFENDIGYECFTPDVLNLGVSPSLLLTTVKSRFLSQGGTIYENTPVKGLVVSNDAGAALDITTPQNPSRILTARLVLDCMGNASPITRQMRFGQKPDGVCAVVGSCASGYDAATNKIGDIIYTNTEIQDLGEEGQLQYFWEAFPVGIGRGTDRSTTKTTYMFTYMDANEWRPSLQTLMSDYWRLLPYYQPSIRDPETDLKVERVLFAFFPTYKESPIKPSHSRLLAIGDASGIQSPLSFGGFGALTRHLGRITGALTEALEKDLLDKESLGAINPYTPNLSAAWMFQKAMSIRDRRILSKKSKRKKRGRQSSTLNGILDSMGVDIKSFESASQTLTGTDPKFVNRLLAVNFEIMNEMGEDTMKPFLQDVVRFDGLVGSLSRAFVKDPTFMPAIVSHVGLGTLGEWLGHVGTMGWYSFLDAAASPVIERVLFTKPEGRRDYDDDDYDDEEEYGDNEKTKSFAERFLKEKDAFLWKRRMEAWKYGSGRDYIF